MADYRQKSDSLLSYIKNQLSTFGVWTNVPGYLRQVSSSSGGYSWGIERVYGGVWYCKEPCSDANWKNVAIPAAVLDIVTDAQYVYILYETDETVTPSSDIQKNDNVVIQTGNRYIGNTGLSTTPTTFRIAYLTGSSIGFKTLDGKWLTAIPTVPGAFETSTTYPDDSPGPWEIFSWNSSFPNSTNLASAHGNIKIINESTGDFAYGQPPTLFSLVKQVSPVTQRKRKFARMPVDGSGSWESYDAQGDGNNLEVSDAFLFLGKKGCAKPCNTNNWVDIPQPGGTGLNQGTFSASAGSVYNIQLENGVYKTYKGTGTGQGGWVELRGLQNKIPLSTSIDNTAIYATPTDPAKYGTLERCAFPYDSEDLCKKVSTDGRNVTSVSVNPGTSRVWMTTNETASRGNIFQRLDNENEDVVLNEFGERDQELQRDVNSLGGDVRITQAEVSAGMTRKEASDIISEATNLSGNISGTLEEAEKLRSQIRQGKKEEAGYSKKMLPLQILTFTLAVVLLIYLTAGLILPSSITSIVAVLGLSAGLGVAIYFAVTNK
jgi:hypothetical protein